MSRGIVSFGFSVDTRDEAVCSYLWVLASDETFWLYDHVAAKWIRAKIAPFPRGEEDETN